MNRADRRLLRFIEAILRGRKPRPGAAGDDARAMQLAARLHAAHPGAADPSPDFVDSLARRLRQNETAQGAATDAMPERRRFLATAGLAAAAGIGAGIGINRLTEGSGPAQIGVQTALAPAEPEWVPVARVADLPVGTIQRFSANRIEGFVLNVGGRISALSAVCTDQGALLAPGASGTRLECPCHYANFNLDGTPADGKARWGLTPLPSITVRMNGENVEALLPKIA